MSMTAYNILECRKQDIYIYNVEKEEKTRAQRERTI